jgi:hypothetical protein
MRLRLCVLLPSLAKVCLVCEPDGGDELPAMLPSCCRLECSCQCEDGGGSRGGA